MSKRMLGVYEVEDKVFYEQYSERVHGEELRKSTMYTKREDVLCRFLEFQWPVKAEIDRNHDFHEAYRFFEDLVATTKATYME